MKKPYIVARKRPCAGDCEPLTKNDTVIGTIGNTQGVNNAAKPQRIAVMIELQSRSPLVVVAAGAAASVTTASPGIWIVKSTMFAVH